MTRAEWHPAAPEHLKSAVATLVETNGRRVRGVVAAVSPRSPVYALSLETSDEPKDVYPITVSLGVEEDRRRLVGTLSAWDALVEVWNPGVYSYSELEVDDPVHEPSFAEAARRVCAWLAEVDVLDFARWVLEEVAAELTRAPPPVPVTEDFVVFPSHQGEDLDLSLRWIAPPHVQRMLERKQLLVDDPNSLEGAPRYDEWEDEP